MSRAALVTAAELTSLSRRTFSAAELTTLASLITSVEAFVASYCLDWESEAAGTRHDYDGNGTAWLYLGRYLATCTAVADDGSALDLTNDLLVRGHYIRYKDATFSEGEENIQVTGTWGWAAAANAPADFKLLVQQICLEALTAYFDREEQSVSLGGVSQQFLLGLITRDSMIRTTWLKYAGPFVY